MSEPAGAPQPHTAAENRDSGKTLSWFAILAPGILVAATGVGAGDLITASLGGSAVGLSLLWAAWAGALLKWFLNEGIARWQMATDTTLLEGWSARLGGVVRWVFLFYLLVWSIFVSGALVTACGVAGTGLLPLHSDPAVSKQIWGVMHALLGLALVWIGGFALLERLMALFIGVMFACVVVTTVALPVDWGAVARRLFTPTLPLVNGTLDADRMRWFLGVLGGVGGTLTLLSYGYWIREQRRAGRDGLRLSRIDLAVGYAITALFGVCMILIGSQLELSGSGARMGSVIADKVRDVLGDPVGGVARWLFLVGFWGAVFSSLLGVWQSVPYIFADFVALNRGRGPVPAETRLALQPAYRFYLVFIALVGLPLLWFTVQAIQLTYAVLGALFMPLLALTLLIMNNQARWVGREFRNGWLTNAVLAVTLLFFAYAGVNDLVRRFAGG
jgi:Mn2+/Fe2+ NRAMP family transporter